MRKYFYRYTLAGAVLAFIGWLYLAPTDTVAAVIQAIVPTAVPTAFRNGTGTARFQLTDSSGNLDTAGSITSGAGSGVAGVFDLTQGTAPTFSAANTFSLYAPASIGTSYQWKVPAADASGCIQSNGAGVLSIAACGSGGGSAGSTLFSTTASTTVTAASATTLIGTVTGSTTIPANTFTAGAVMQIQASGYYSTPVAARTLTINLKIAGSTQLTTGALTVLPSITNGVWRLLCNVTTRTAGGSGTQIGNCIFEMAPSSTSVLTPADGSMQASATWSIDTTTTNAVDLQAAWDSTTGSPTITATNVAAWIPGAPVSSVGGLTGAVPGGWILQEQHTASTSAALNFTTCITSAYDDYVIRIINLLPATDAVSLDIDVSTDGGSTYDTTATHYSGNFLFVDASSTGISGTTSNAHFLIADNISNSATNAGLTGLVNFYSPAYASGHKQIQANFVHFNANNSFGGAQSMYGGSYTQSTAVNAFRLIMSIGNITSGTARCYGVAKQ